MPLRPDGVPPIPLRVTEKRPADGVAENAGLWPSSAASPVTAVLQSLEGVERLGEVEGVRCVQANPLTGNVLAHFDPRGTDERFLLKAVSTVAVSLLMARRLAQSSAGTPPPAGRDGKGSCPKRFDPAIDLGSLVSPCTSPGFCRTPSLPTTASRTSPATGKAPPAAPC